MSIFEYDEEKVLKIIGREKYEDGKISGHVDFIATLLHKGYATEDIADMLDIDTSYVQAIKELITKYPNETSMDIARRMLDNSCIKN